MSDDAAQLADLIARARRDGAGPERLAAVRARLEAQVGPLDASPPASAMAATSKVALGIAAIAALGLAAWLATRVGSPPPDPVRDEAPAPRAPSAPEPRVESEPAIADPIDVAAPADRARPAPLEDPSPASPRGRRVVAPPPAAAEAPPPADPSSTLREEIALLDRAIRARNAGDVARAVAVLEEHRTRFPSGRLQPDRDRLLAELASSAPAPTPP